MRKLTKLNKVAAFLVALSTLFSMFIVAETTGANENENESGWQLSDAALVLSGLTFQKDDQEYIQALVKVTLKDIDATGISFNIVYDPDILVPSDYETNQPATEPKQAWHYDETVFKSGYSDFFLTSQYGWQVGETSTYFNLFPNPDGEIEDGEPLVYGTYHYSETNYEQRKLFNARGTELTLGYISFRVIDEKNLSQTAEPLKFYADEDLEKPNDAGVMYIVDENTADIVEGEYIKCIWDTEKKLLSAEAKNEEIETSAYTVFYESEQPEITDGDYTPYLINYLNKHHDAVICKYTDNTYDTQYITWGEEGKDFTIDKPYDPRGGTYTITQKFDDEHTVSITVTVDPVYLIGLDAQPQTLNIESEKPENDNRDLQWEDLNVPTEASLILSGEFDTFVPPKITLSGDKWDLDDEDEKEGENWQPETVPKSLLEDTPIGTAHFTYDASDSLSDITADNPWITIDSQQSDTELKITRNAGTEQDLKDNTTDPLENVSAEVARETGIMTITAPSAFDPSESDEDRQNTSFKIYLPNGIVLDTADEEDKKLVKVTINGDDVTITIDTTSDEAKEVSEAKRNAIQSVINLGSDDYNITKTSPGKLESEKTQFGCERRINYYISETKDENGVRYIEVNYAEGNAGIFEVYPDQPLENISTYLEFPDGVEIPVAYDGVSGIDGAALGAAKVTKWHIEDSSETTLPAVGETVTLVGTLQNYSYANMGWVYNPDPDAADKDYTDTDSVVLKLKVRVQEGEYNQNEKIQLKAIIDEATKLPVTEGMIYNFDTKQYDNYFVPQIAAFEIENIGEEEIKGLGISIISDENNAFMIDTPVEPVNIAGEEKAVFKIRNTVGLEIGEHTATVRVSSNTGKLIDYVIKFTVSDYAVYKITVKSDPEDGSLGSAYILSEDMTREIPSRTYKHGDEINMAVAVSNLDYRFKEWNSETDGVVSKISETSADEDRMNLEYKYTLDATAIGDITNEDGENELVITAVFDESIAAQLRLEDLELKADKSGRMDIEFRNPDDLKKKISFDPGTLEYTAYASNDTDEAYVWFKPRYTEIDGNPIDIKVALTNTTVTDKELETELDETENSPSNGFRITIDPAELDVGENTVTVTLSYGDEEPKTYTIKVIRKEPVDVDIMYGNSPFGLIMNETSEEHDDTWKTEAKQYFHENHTYGEYIPSTAGDTTLTYYSTEAWDSEDNYDENEYALFVYNGTVFADPGYKDLKDELGNDIPVTRKITVDVLSSTVSANAADDILNVGSDPVTITVADTGETCNITELKDLRIRPGVYRLVYEFVDPADGLDTSFSKPLIILSPKGDVNSDKNVDSTDISAIYERFTFSGNGNSFLQTIIRADTDWGRLIAYRSADINEDRNANTIDANAIVAGTDLSMREYYVKLPANKNASYSTRLSTETKTELPEPPSEKATLCIDKLGITGLNSKPKTEPYPSNITAKNVTNGDIIWYGVAVDNLQNIGEYFTKDGITSFDIALDYDPDILEPCHSNGSTDFNDVIREIRLTNMSFGETAEPDDNLLWDWDTYEVDEARASLDYAPPDNDFARQRAADSSYKTLYIPIHTTGTGTSYRFKGLDLTKTAQHTYLIRVGFKIKGVPNPSKDAVTLHLGPQTFIMGTGESGTETYAAWESADKTDPAVNLANYFTYIGDYGEGEYYLESLQVFKAETSEDPQPEDMEIKELYRAVRDETKNPVIPYDPKDEEKSDPDKDLSKFDIGFIPKWHEYYVSVDYEVSKISLKFTPDFEGTTVTQYLEVESVTDEETGDVTTAELVDNGKQPSIFPREEVGTVNITSSDDGAYVTDDITLTDVNPSILTDSNADGKGDRYGFSNVIEITLPDGETVYTVHVRKLLKPEIHLEYGNSPKGLIWRDTYHGWTEADRKKVLSKFQVNALSTIYRFDPVDDYKYVPVVKVVKGKVEYAQTERPYSTLAWNRKYYPKNYDLDEYAFFIYQGKTTRDPGFSCINELGLNDKSVKIKAVVPDVKIIGDSYVGIPSYDPDDNKAHVKTTQITATGQYFSLASKFIRPQAYTCHYTASYTDTTSRKWDLEAERPFIVLYKLGDVSIQKNNSQITQSDGVVLKNNVNTIKKCNPLYIYRIADVDMPPNFRSISFSQAEGVSLLKYFNDASLKNFLFYPSLY